MEVVVPVSTMAVDHLRQAKQIVHDNIAKDPADVIFGYLNADLGFLTHCDVVVAIADCHSLPA